MKKLIAILLSVALLCGIFAGCSVTESTSTATTAAPAAVKAENQTDTVTTVEAINGLYPEVQVAVSADMEDLSPCKPNGTTRSNVFWSIYETLFDLDDNQKLIPNLASGYTVVSDTAWDVTLYENIYDTDGNHITADDVVFDVTWLIEGGSNICLSNDNTPQREKQILSRRNKTPYIDAIVDREAYFATTLKNCEFLFAEDGDVFDLGGLRLIVYPIPGHTKGSIGLYCPELKAVFTGDTMEFEHKLVYGQKMTVSAPPYAFIRALSRLEKLDIETVWPAEKALITDTKAMLIDWAHNADPEKDVFYDTKPSPFSPPGTPHYAYHYKHLTLSYNVGHLEQIREYMAEHNGAVE